MSSTKDASIRVYAYLRVTLSCSEWARDVTQDVFIKAFDRIGTYTGHGGFSAWLFRIARNCALDELKAMKPEAVAPGDIRDSDPSALTWVARLDAVSDRELYDAIERLPGDYAQVVTLRFLAGFNCREIADLIGRSPNAVRKLQVRALADLRVHLRPLPGSSGPLPVAA